MLNLEAINYPKFPGVLKRRDIQSLAMAAQTPTHAPESAPASWNAAALRRFSEMQSSS
jgi:hypothetical protein